MPYPACLITSKSRTKWASTKTSRARYVFRPDLYSFIVDGDRGRFEPPSTLLIRLYEYGLNYDEILIRVRSTPWIIELVAKKLSRNKQNIKENVHSVHPQILLTEILKPLQFELA